MGMTFTQEVREFRGEKRQVIVSHQYIDFDASSLRELHRSTVVVKAPLGGCDDVHIGQLDYAVQADGALRASFVVNYQVRRCMTGTCFMGWSSTLIPYPIFGRCEWNIDVTGLSSEVLIQTIVTPRLNTLSSDTVQLVLFVTTTPYVKHGPSELVKNIAGVISFGTLSKLMADTFEHQMGDLRASLSPMTTSTGPFSIPGSGKGSPVRFSPAKTAFEMRENKVVLSIGFDASNDSAIGCRVREEAIVTQRYFQSCLQPKTSYVVQKNDTMWGIAKALYGDGHYFQSIAHASGVSPLQPLKPGVALKIRPFFELLNGQEVLVRPHDSLWSIAEKRLGDGRRYKELIADDPTALAKSDRLPALLTLGLPHN
jgi:hypothetical protein